MGAVQNVGGGLHAPNGIWAAIRVLNPPREPARVVGGVHRTSPQAHGKHSAVASHETHSGRVTMDQGMAALCPENFTYGLTPSCPRAVWRRGREQCLASGTSFRTDSPLQPASAPTSAP